MEGVEGGRPPPVAGLRKGNKAQRSGQGKQVRIDVDGKKEEGRCGRRKKKRQDTERECTEKGEARFLKIRRERPPQRGKKSRGKKGREDASLKSAPKSRSKRCREEGLTSTTDRGNAKRSDVVNWEGAHHRQKAVAKQKTKLSAIWSKGKSLYLLSALETK